MLRLAQFGLGTLGRLELETFDDLERVEIVAGADPVDKTRRSFEATYGAESYQQYADLLDEHGDELDAVNVVTPHGLHYEQAMAAMEHDLAVHLEKPMVTDLGDAVALTEAARERDLVVQVGYQRHFDPRFQTIRELVSSGAVGDVVGASCFLEQDWIAQLGGTWRTDPSLSGGGQLYDSGSHLLDSLLWTTDASPDEVAAVVERDGHEVDVHASLSIALERDGRTLPASVFVTGDGPTSPDTRDGLVVWGTEGSVEYGPEGVTVRHEGAAPEHEAVDVYDYPTLTARKLRAFVEAVAGERENPVPPETGTQVIALTEAAYVASDEGRTVDVAALVDAARAERA